MYKKIYIKQKLEKNLKNHQKIKLEPKGIFPKR
jgi:hypothetical protein